MYELVFAFVFPVFPIAHLLFTGMEIVGLLLIALKVAEVLLVAAMVLIGMDLAIFHYKSVKEDTRLLEKGKKEATKASIRQEKEEHARREAVASGGFFEESFVQGFDPRVGAKIYYCCGTRVSSGSQWDYYIQLDGLADTQIFLNTEDF